MSEPAFYNGLIVVSLALSVVTFVALMWITAPYGRYVRGGWGPSIPSTVGWVVMEAPAVLVPLGFFLLGEHRGERVPQLLLVMWLVHYVNRAFVFPFRRRGGQRPMPAAVAALAIVFNVANGYLNGRWLSHFGAYPDGWLADPRFVAGALLFFVGMAINWQSDRILMNLRAPGETGYKIPVGGLYRWVSSPNYFGETIEWIGWAVAAWSRPGVAFAIWTAANLLPRAVANHRWYREKFPDYPASRRAIIPRVW